METLHVNFHKLANANIDWSLDGGMIWLTSMMVIFCLVVGWIALEGN